MQKTLGGDRLGAGNKMKVHLHNYERSTHDLGYIWRSTMSAGTLVPFMSQVALPGDTFDIDLNCDIKTHPTIGPLFGSYKVQLDIFMAPIRLYNSWLHNNKLGIGRNMSQVKLPQLIQGVWNVTLAQFEAIKDKDNYQINPSSLLAYLGIRGWGVYINPTEDTEFRSYNAIPILMYWEIYKNYYANKQEEIGAVIHTDQTSISEDVNAIDIVGVATVPEYPTESQNVLTLPTTILEVSFAAAPIPEDANEIIVYSPETGEITFSQLVGGLTWMNTATQMRGFYDAATWGTITLRYWRLKNATDMTNSQPRVVTFPLENLDLMREAILVKPGDQVFNIYDGSITPYTWLGEGQFPDNAYNVLSSQEGLAIKTYQSDLFNNWLKTENIDAITTSTAIDTTGGSFSIDQLNLSRKIYNMLNRINVSGGAYNDWLDAVYTHDKYRQCESPMYMGGLIKELVFQEVVSNSESESGQPLGTLAGKGVLGKKHKGGSVIIKVDEPSYIMGIISLTPRIDYSQGNSWDVNLKTMDDLHKPALDEIGFQELITEQLAWWDTHWDGTKWLQASAGKQPAWINYMTNVNKTYGNFAIRDNEMFMTLNRRYEIEEGDDNIKDLTTYIDPAKFNFIFAETALDAQNFWAQIAVNITARRKMSAKIMPNL